MSEKDMIQVMDPEGNADKDAIADISKDERLKMYRLMMLTKLWNGKALSLQRQGRLGTIASVRGQEAANVGMGLALEPEDWFAPAFREFGAMFARGFDPVALFQYWGGDERGARPPEGSHTLPVCITVGSHLCHAVGIAMAAKIRKDRIAVMSSSGDGSTSQGDFHESLNFAGVFKSPVVFVIQNNHWAISIPVEHQTATATIAEKACAYGIDGLRVDGNDVFAVYLTLKKRLKAAREDYKPALVELVTYRLDDHTTSDDAKRYRKDDIVAPWRAKDPIERMRKFLTKEEGWTDEKDQALIDELTAEVEADVKRYEDTPNPEPETMFDHVYAEPPWFLKEERAYVKNLYGEKAR